MKHGCFDTLAFQRFPFDAHEQLQAARMAAGLSIDEAARWCGVTARTWRAWERGSSPVPHVVLRFSLILAGVLPWRDWRAFQIAVDGALELVSDPRLRVYPLTVRQVPYFQALAAEARRRLKALEANPDWPQLPLFRDQ